MIQHASWEPSGLLPANIACCAVAAARQSCMACTVCACSVWARSVAPIRKFGQRIRIRTFRFVRNKKYAVRLIRKYDICEPRTLPDQGFLGMAVARFVSLCKAVRLVLISRAQQCRLRCRRGSKALLSDRVGHTNAETEDSRHKLSNEPIGRRFGALWLLSCNTSGLTYPYLYETIRANTGTYTVCCATLWARADEQGVQVLHAHEWGGAFVDVILASHFRQLPPGFRVIVEPHGGHVWYALACLQGS